MGFRYGLWIAFKVGFQVGISGWDSDIPDWPKEYQKVHFLLSVQNVVPIDKVQGSHPQQTSTSEAGVEI